MAAVIAFPSKPYDRRATHLIVSEVATMDTALDIATLADEIGDLIAQGRLPSALAKCAALKQRVKDGFDQIYASARVDPELALRFAAIEAA